MSPTRVQDRHVDALRVEASRLRALGRRLGRVCEDCGLPLSRYNPDRRCGPCSFGRR